MENSILNRTGSYTLGDFLTGEIVSGIRVTKGFPMKANERNALVADDESASGFLHPFHPTINLGNWVVENLPWWIPALGEGNRRGLPESLRARYRGVRIPRLPHPAVPEGVRIVTRTHIVPNGFSIDPQEALISTKALEFRVAAGDVHWLLPILNSPLSRLALLSRADVRSDYFAFTNPDAVAQIPIPCLTRAERNLLGRLTFCRLSAATLPQRTADRGMLLRYFEQILEALVYEVMFREEMLEGLRVSFFDALSNEDIPEIGSRQPERLKALFRRLFNRNHPVRGGVYFLNSIKSVRLINEKIGGLSKW